VHRVFAWLLAGVVGIAAGATSHVLGAAVPSLTAGTVASYAVLTRLAATHPDVVHEEGVAVWRVGRWSGVSTAFLLAVVLFALGALPVGARLRLSLGILVFGVGWAMWVLGVAYARRKARRHTRRAADGGGQDL
jgi:hypothetical protein